MVALSSKMRFILENVNSHRVYQLPHCLPLTSFSPKNGPLFHARADPGGDKGYMPPIKLLYLYIKGDTSLIASSKKILVFDYPLKKFSRFALDFVR